MDRRSTDGVIEQGMHRRSHGDMHGVMDKGTSGVMDIRSHGHTESWTKAHTGIIVMDRRSHRARHAQTES